MSSFHGSVFHELRRLVAIEQDVDHPEKRYMMYCFGKFRLLLDKIEEEHKQQKKKNDWNWYDELDNKFQQFTWWGDVLDELKNHENVEYQKLWERRLRGLFEDCYTTYKET